MGHRFWLVSQHPSENSPEGAAETRQKPNRYSPFLQDARFGTWQA